MTAKEYLTLHGITDKTASTFGLREEAGKLVIPIKDYNGEFLFNKYRNLSFVKGGDDPKFTYDKGSSAALFNAEVIKNNTGIIICEGEPDVIRLAQAGIPAVCSTSGAGTFEEEWVPMFTGKKVFICYDTDEAGREGAEKLKTLFPMALEIILPAPYKDICDYLVEHKNGDFKNLIAKVIEENFVSYEKLCEVIDKWLLLPDKNVIKVTLGTIIAHNLESDPLWLMLVAPPSGTKTEIINCLSALPFIYELSDLTPQTFASGMPGKDVSLLPKLSNQVLTMKDFTTVLNMRDENKAMILSQLREIYDGKYSKEFGTGKRVDWEGKLGLVVGVTTIVDKYSSVFQVMGERFILYRIPQPNDKEVALRALTNTGSEDEMRSELKTTFRKFFGNITIPSIKEIEIPQDIAIAISSLASFAVIARSGVIRFQNNKEIELIPTPEAPGRLTKQLGVLIKSLAILERRKTVTWADYFLVLKVAFDVIPQNRSKHIAALCGTSEFNGMPTSIVAKQTGYSIAGAELPMEDLVALGLAGMNPNGRHGANEWYLSEKTRDYFRDILTCPDSELDNLKKIFVRGMTNYDSIIDQLLALRKKEGEEIEPEKIVEGIPEMV